MTTGLIAGAGVYVALRYAIHTSNKVALIGGALALGLALWANVGKATAL